jgi:hypothetical protein
MSISDKIATLTSVRNRQREKLAGMGLVDSAAKFEAITTAIEGITDNGAVSTSVKEGESYKIPAGWHNGGGVVTGVSGGGNYKLEDTKTITPTKTQQSITPSEGFYGLAGVVVNPIPTEFQDVSDVTAIASHVLAGDIFVDAEGTPIAGTMHQNGAVNGTIDGLTVTSYTIPEGYHNGGGTVSLTSDIEDALAAL